MVWLHLHIPCERVEQFRSARGVVYVCHQPGREPFTLTLPGDAKPAPKRTRKRKAA